MRGLVGKGLAPSASCIFTRLARAVRFKTFRAS